MYEVVPRPSLIQSRSVTRCCPLVAFSGGICDFGFMLSEKKCCVFAHFPLRSKNRSAHAELRGQTALRQGKCRNVEDMTIKHDMVKTTVIIISSFTYAAEDTLLVFVSYRVECVNK